MLMELEVPNAQLTIHGAHLLSLKYQLPPEDRYCEGALLKTEHCNHLFAKVWQKDKTPHCVNAGCDVLHQ